MLPTNDDLNATLARISRRLTWLIVGVMVVFTILCLVIVKLFAIAGRLD